MTLYLLAKDVDEVADIIADQRKYGGDIEILLPDGTWIKGTLRESSGLIINMNSFETPDMFNVQDIKEVAMWLVGVGDAFVTNVGVEPNVISRRWSRLKPGR